jgi:pimeloyl-ACP methyl ester carboxylesterase
VVEARLRPFQSGDYSAYFNAMLADPDACLDALRLTAAEAGRLTARVSILHGRLDRACPDSALLAQLAPLLPSATVTLLGGCGHNVITERPADVRAALLRLAEEIMPE